MTARIFFFIRYVTILRKDGFFSFLWLHRRLLFHHNLCLFLYQTGNSLDLGYKEPYNKANRNIKHPVLNSPDLDLRYLQHNSSLLTSLWLKKTPNKVNIRMRLWMKLNTIISLSFGWLAFPFCPPFDDLFADLFHSVLILHMK